MKFSVVIPTRGDVDLTPILASYEGIADEVLVWDNSKREDLAVYGRYAAIAEAKHDLILTQDDDCVVSDPQAIVDAWLESGKYPFDGRGSPWGSDPRDFVDHVVCNMPPEFRHSFYEEHALVGFGACFHRDAPARAFQRASWWPGSLSDDMGFFYRTCDIVFTALTPRVLVDVPKTNLWWAENHTRMWRQEKHIEERTRMLELVKKVRDA